MIKHFFDEILLSGGWRQNQLLSISDRGEILAIADGEASKADMRHKGFAVPGVANVHSHAFQRAMAGLAEIAGPVVDSFWSWRQVMYKFLSVITPEQLEAIAAQLYLEMLKAGFTSVGEFHYLHHDRDGSHFADPAEMSGRIMAAAEEAGIGLTLLPVLYRYSGFGSAQPLDHQRRFIMEGDAFLELVAELQRRAKDRPDVVIGIAPHSLRAVDPQLLQEVLAGIDNNIPCHIHIAEQKKEISDCLDWCGKRPVEWLLGNAPVADNWCLIHATHITEAERQVIAASDAVAGLCPITEANLGDGLFPVAEFLDEGGKIALGSDSNIYVSLVEEIRLLEYGQRLFRQSRNILGDPTRSTGMRIFLSALAGGHQALGRLGPAGLQIGSQADFVLLDAEHPALAGKPSDKILDSWLFAGDNSVIKDVAVGGRIVIHDRHHEKEGEITDRFRRVMTELAANA